jgi:hypothetical protein
MQCLKPRLSLSVLLLAWRLCRQATCMLLLLLVLLPLHAVLAVLQSFGAAVADRRQHAVRATRALTAPRVLPACRCCSRHGSRRCRRNCCQVLRQHPSNASCCCRIGSCSSALPHAAGPC